ncbi:MAG TPA: cache domain-containing protein, partial [Nitrospirota bacterium]|nr:cache domain-containing protein [Nitrospirota bacterium]
MFKVKSLSTKLIILLITAVLVPLSLYGTLSIGTSRHYNFKIITEGNSNVAKRAAAEINLYVTNSIAILNALSQNIGRFNIPAHEQELILSNYVLNFPEIQEICITDSAGKKIISADGRSPDSRCDDIAYHAAIRGEIYKSEVFISTNMAPSMTIAMPIKRLNTVEGAAIADISLIAMWRLVDSIKIGESGYAFVISGDGQLIAHGLGDGKVRVLSHENMKSLEIVKGVLQGRHSTGLYKNIEGTEVIGVAAPIPSLGWGIVIEEPLTEAYAPVRRMTILLALLIILFVAAASATGYAG